MDNHSGRRDRKGLTGCLRPVATNPVMLCQIMQCAMHQNNTLHSSMHILLMFKYGTIQCLKPKCTGKSSSLKLLVSLKKDSSKHCYNLGGLNTLPHLYLSWIKLLQDQKRCRYATVPGGYVTVPVLSLSCLSLSLSMSYCIPS